jgi:selenocysteine-specific elongation factor
MRVIGTAGHVDHGKSTLVEALTGTHPDRLKEEREREMTIDLGFAWLVLPTGEEIGIVDVPGHRDFIENMLAGVGGIDAALFVVAADEGVMPQTREHLAILDLLQIQGGVVALTKTDLVPDADWLELVEDDLRKALAGTVLQEAPIVRVSARKREGLDRLLQALGDCLANSPPRQNLGRPRLPIDRVFSVAGFGTVVTGTLSDGQLRLGDEVEILPQGSRGRVRGLQAHKRKEEVAAPGSRTAVNISGVQLDQVYRGDVVAHPGDYLTTRRLDVRFRLLADIAQPLEHNTEVKFYLGAAEVIARVRLLGKESLLPGEEGWLQLELRQAVCAVRGDRYILRRPSPAETLGGGAVLDPHPKGRHKRFNATVLERLASLSQGSPADVFLQALQAVGFAPLKEVARYSGLESGIARQAAGDLLSQGQLILLEEGEQTTPAGDDQLATSRANWESLSAELLKEVADYHRANPLRSGMPREELKSRARVPPRVFNAALRKLVSAGRLQEAGPLVSLPGFSIQFSPQQEKSVQALLDRYAASPFSPPSVKESIAEVGEDVYTALVEMKKLVQISTDVVFRQEDYGRMRSELEDMFKAQGTLTAAQVRDHFDTSRRYVLALLEHLDSIGVTVREGDVRRLRARR